MKLSRRKMLTVSAPLLAGAVLSPSAVLSADIGKSPLPDTGSGYAAGGPIDIGTRRELFVDKYLVAEMKGVSPKLHTPVKAPRAKSPLPVRHMVTVIKDGDLYRAWYRGMDPAYTGDKHTGHPGESVFYAESRDGHEWVLPKLRLHEIGGSLENNAILVKQPPFLTNFMPFLDARPGVDLKERYKAVAGYPGGGNKLGSTKKGIGLYGFVSPDGIQWTRQEEIIPYRPEWRHAFDSPNIAFWSDAEQQYVCYFRTWTADRLRTIARSTSRDFVKWTNPVEMNPNLPGENLYTSMTHPYVRAPHIYIALPTRFVPGGTDSADVVMENITDVLFMTTRAGSTRYDRLFTEAFIRPGLDPRQWTNRANYVAQNVLQTSPTELSIYHRSGDRYVVRVDGFISVNAGANKGSFKTKPLRFEGSRLELNYSTSALGFVGIQMLNSKGKILAESEPLIGDAVDGLVKWKRDADLSQFAGQPVYLSFEMREADLYSFRFDR